MGGEIRKSAIRREKPWCPGPESNRYAPIKEAADFKSDVSTNFTTRAGFAIVKQKGPVK